MKKLQSLGFTLSNQQMKKIVGGYDTCECVCQHGNFQYSPPSTDGCELINSACEGFCSGDKGGLICVSRCCAGCP